VNDIDDHDPAGHQHKLETEGAGPTASNMVAEELTALLDGTPNPAAHIVPGRFVYADGSLSRRAQTVTAGGTEDAVAIWVGAPGATALGPNDGTIVAIDDIGAFGDRAVDAAGTFMDYDGQRQGGPDITTRGMASGDDLRYVDVYPALDADPLGAAKNYCDDTAAPSSTPAKAKARHRRMVARGTASDEGCAGGADTAARDGQVKKVEAAVSKRLGSHRCRYLGSDGRLRAAGPCSARTFLDAQGTDHWRLHTSLPKRLPRGRYRARSRAVDAAGNVEPRSPSSVVRFRVH
jgi:hypothetical protein